jgi:superfamily II DNA or RNA helicase
MERELLTALKIECLLLKYPQEIRESLHGLDYQHEIDWIVNCDKRNQLIAQLASSVKGNTLVLFQYVEKHGKPLFEMIQKMAPTTIENRKVFFVAGETDVDDRESIRHIVEKEENAIIVASYGTFSTGINIKSLKNLIFASPSKSRIRILQSIGRQLRKSETKDIAKLYDIADDLHWEDEPNYTFKHFMSRLKLYDEEGFPYKIVKLPVYGGAK